MNSILLTSRSNISNNLTISHTTHHEVNVKADDDEEESEDEDIADKSADLATNSSNANQFISDKLCLIIYELNTIRPAFLELLMPQLEYKLKSNEVKERREYTRLLSKMFSEKDSQLAEKFPQLWDAYLERFADMNEDIRKICIQHICEFLSRASRVSDVKENVASNKQILEQIIEQVKNRSLDPEETLRYEVVQEILKAIKQDNNLINTEILNILKDRTLDVKVIKILF